jgi:hypothetical protein
MTSMGPVEYVVIAFPGNRFKGEIVPAVAELVDHDVVRIIDVVFIWSLHGPTAVTHCSFWAIRQVSRSMRYHNPTAVAPLRRGRPRSAGGRCPRSPGPTDVAPLRAGIGEAGAGGDLPVSTARWPWPHCSDVNGMVAHRTFRPSPRPVGRGAIAAGRRRRRWR